MALDELAAALLRAQAVLQRRPDLGPHDDAPATASWENGTRIVVKASSRSDTRGVLGMAGSSGETIYAGPSDVAVEAA